MSRVRYKIVKAPVSNKKFDELYDALKGLVSMHCRAGFIIIARYGVNKSTLKKLLKKEIV